MIEGYIVRNGLDAPDDPQAALRDGFAQPLITELEVRTAGITSVIWAAGYSFDFDLIKLPVTDGDGFPIQQRGVTAYPGLYFAGLTWLPAQKSGLLLGVGEQAAHIADHIANHKQDA